MTVPLQHRRLSPAAVSLLCPYGASAAPLLCLYHAPTVSLGSNLVAFLCTVVGAFFCTMVEIIICGCIMMVVLVVGDDIMTTCIDRQALALQHRE